MSEVTKRLIRDIKVKEHVQTTFLVSEKNTGKDRNGKPFLSVTLADSSGVLNGRMFENVEESAQGFSDGDIVWIKGFVQLFQNRKQLVMHDIRIAQESEYKMSDLIADLGGDPRQHLADLIAVVESLEDQYIRRILLDTLSDSGITDILVKAPAAKTIHHAYRGGLIEHIHSIVKVMLSLVGHYDFLNKDLLVFGAIYHDLGKIYELDLASGIHYTQRGRLVGHMALACEMIDARAAQIEGFPQDHLDILKHIVLSHHGRIEYGSPKLPMMPEALVVAMIDDLDSKMNTLFHFLKTEVETIPTEEKWSHYHPGFERYFFLDFFRNQIK